MSNREIVVNQGTQNQAGIVVRKNTGDAITLNSLKNVDTTDLQDGYTLVYDTVTNKWISQQITVGTVDAIDGGTY
jgi:hypothetical protein